MILFWIISLLCGAFLLFIIWGFFHAHSFSYTPNFGKPYVMFVTHGYGEDAFTKMATKLIAKRGHRSVILSTPHYSNKNMCKALQVINQILYYYKPNFIDLYVTLAKSILRPKMVIYMPPSYKSGNDAYCWVTNFFSDNRGFSNCATFLVPSETPYIPNYKIRDDQKVLTNFYITSTIKAKRKITPKKLFIYGFGGPRRGSKAFVEMQDELDKRGLASFSGPECFFGHYKGYAGLLGGDEFFEKMQECGIGFCANLSNTHTGSMRIFELASAGVVIISDTNEFIIKEFGDSVLYVDPDDPKIPLKDQVMKHMNWILSHPAEALKMANKANKIFLKKFTLEKTIDRLISQVKDE